MKLSYFAIPLVLILAGAGCAPDLAQPVRPVAEPVAVPPSTIVQPGPSNIAPVPAPQPTKIGLGLSGYFLMPQGLVAAAQSFDENYKKNHYETGMTVYPEKTYETLLGVFEGETPPPFITFTVYGNPDAYDALTWAQKNSDISSYNLMTGKSEVAPTIKSNLDVAAPGIRYNTDDIYGARVSVYITPNKDHAILITENYSGSDDTATQMMFEQLLQSFVVRGVK